MSTVIGAAGTTPALQTATKKVTLAPTTPAPEFEFRWWVEAKKECAVASPTQNLAIGACYCVGYVRGLVKVRSCHVRVWCPY